MSYVRSDGYRLKDPDDDAAYQVTVGDLKRLQLNLYRGTPNAAYSLTPKAIEGLNDSSGQAPDHTENSAGTSGAFLVPANNLSDVLSALTSAFNLGTLRLGSYTNTATYTSGSGTHTFGTSAKFFIVQMAGGGGGGGSGDGNSTVTYPNTGKGAGGGGGSGELVHVLGLCTAASMTYAVGAGGSAASTGGSSTITLSGTTITATGGAGGSNFSSFFGGDGGAGGFTAPASTDHTNMITIRNQGSPGSSSRVLSVSFDSAGAVSQYTLAVGLGGKIYMSSPNYGKGGDGDFSSSPGSGTGGFIKIYELSS